MIEFQPYGKTPRLYDAKGVVITEKIDGSNGALLIKEVPYFSKIVRDSVTESLIGPFTRVYLDDVERSFVVAAQSRRRIVTPGDDNFAFAKWAYENAATLALDLGEGTHFGEWWGQGIQRTYGQREKFFSLFNVRRWKDAAPFATPNLGVVPVLAEGSFTQERIEDQINYLELYGSRLAAQGWTGKAEGVIVFHTASGQIFKAFCEGQG